MRILIQQKETGFYFKDVGAWTRNPTEAMGLPQFNLRH